MKEAAASLISSEFLKISFNNLSSQNTIKKSSLKAGRAVDPHSFFADPHPAVLLNAEPDPDPAAF